MQRGETSAPHFPSAAAASKWDAIHQIYFWRNKEKWGEREKKGREWEKGKWYWRITCRPTRPMLARPASGCWRPERTCSPDSSRSRAADGGAGIGRGSSAPTVPNTFSSVRACADPSRQEIRLKRTHPSFVVEKKSTKPKFQREFLCWSSLWNLSQSSDSHSSNLTRGAGRPAFRWIKRPGCRWPKVQREPWGRRTGHRERLRSLACRQRYTWRYLLYCLIW